MKQISSENSTKSLARQQQASRKVDGESVVKHIVMWNLKGETEAQTHDCAVSLKAKFESLLGKIPGMQHIEVGIDISHVDYACDVVLYSEFTSIEALNIYATHPEHLRVRSELGDMRIARYQVDYVLDKNGSSV